MALKPYLLLGTYATAGDDAIRLAWIKQMRSNHPDRGGRHDDAVMFNAAYEAVATAEARRRRRLEFQSRGCRECVTCDGSGYERRGTRFHWTKEPCHACDGEGLR